MIIEKALKFLLIFCNIVLSIVLIDGYFKVFSFRFHIVSASIGVMLSFFIYSSVLFYFIGTGIWMRDKSKAIFSADEALGLSCWEIYEKANKLKGRVFPSTTLVLFLALFTFLMGGALQVKASNPWLHPSLAVLLVLLAWFSWPIIKRNIHKNVEFLDIISESEIKLSQKISSNS